MNYSLNDEIAVIRGMHSFFLVAKANARFPLCIESQAGEVCQGIDPADLIVVSAPEGGPLEPGIMMIEMVRAYHTPLLVLPREHPGSRRISHVVSVGPVIHASCSIQRGTHPEQNVICSHAELAGMTFTSTPEGFEVMPSPEGISVRRLKYRIFTEFC
jgi:hypothetical protein